MTDREKLIEVLKATRANAAWHRWGYEEVSDYLIANGVTFAKDTNVLTNADLIRAMSDEELADELIECRDDWCDYCTHVGCFDKFEDALKAEVEWLKQPVEVDDG